MGGVAVGRGVVGDVVVGDHIVAARPDVEEVAEVRSLAISDQRLGQRWDHVELAMPQGHVQLGVGERLDAWHERLDDGCGGRGRRMQAGEGVGDHAADVVSDDVDRPEPEPLDEAVNVFSHRRCVVAVGWSVGTADTTQVDGDDRRGRGEPGKQTAPLVPVLGKAMQQDESRAITAAHVVQRHRADVDGLGGEPGQAEDSSHESSDDSRAADSSVGRAGVTHSKRSPVWVR